MILSLILVGVMLYLFVEKPTPPIERIKGTAVCYSNGIKIFEGRYIHFWSDGQLDGLTENGSHVAIIGAACVAQEGF